MTRFRLAIVVLALLIAGALAYWSQEAVKVGAQEEQAFSCSADERQVQTFDGTQDQTTPSFNIGGDEWRFIAQATATIETGGSLNVSGRDERDLPAGNALLMVNPERNPTSTRSSSVQDGPGTFSLEIDANGVEYTILVCERGGGGQPKTQPSAPTSPKGQPKDRPKEQPKQQPKGQARQQPAPPPRPTPSPPEPSFKAGAPSQGPVPLMPNGRCPREFPVKQGGACWAAS